MNVRIDPRLDVFDLEEADRLRKEDVKVSGLLPDPDIYKGRMIWELSGGKRAQGENIIQTAIRELYEETGSAIFEQKN